MTLLDLEAQIDRFMATALAIKKERDRLIHSNAQLVRALRVHLYFAKEELDVIVSSNSIGVGGQIDEMALPDVERLRRMIASSTAVIAKA